jgi:hypothetical protein
MSNLRTSDGETGDACFEVGHLIEPDKKELSAEPMTLPMTFYFYLLRREPNWIVPLLYRKMRAILGVNVNIAARRCRLRPCHPDLCEGKGGTVSGCRPSSYRDGNNFSPVIDPSRTLAGRLTSAGIHIRPLPVC